MQADFANLIGSHALLAKQLDLRWRWELLPDPAIRRDAREKDVDDEHGGPIFESMSSTSPEERITRKKCHCMPFLMRNLSNCPFQRIPRNTKKSHGRIRRVRTTRREFSRNSSTVDIFTQCFRIGSPNAIKRRREPDSSPSFIRSIRQKISGWFSPPDATNADASKITNGEQAESSSTAHDVKTNVQNGPVRSHPLTAHELFLQSSLVRRMVLDQIDPALHHDEEFVLHRMEGCWQEITSESLVFKSEGIADHGTDDDDDENSDDTSNAKNILSYAYWADMEEKDRKKIQMEKHRRIRHHSKSDVSVTRRRNAAAWNRSTRNRRNLPPIYFHYMYIHRDNHPATAIEKRTDRKCPFCVFYGKNNEDLLFHCGVFHGVWTDHYRWEELKHGLFFQAVLDEDKNLHVIVKSASHVSEDVIAHTAHDFTVLRSHETTHPPNHKDSHVPSKKATHSSIPFLRRSHPNIAAMDPLLRKRRLLALEANDAPVSVISSYLPTDEVPIRQYFHSRTNLPMEDWNDVDSDDESDDEWLHKMSSELMEEFEDVSEREKKFMKLWNRFIFRHVIIADREIPGKCHEFIERHWMELKRGGMRENLLLHLMNLWDSGVVSSNRILACMHLYDTRITST